MNLSFEPRPNPGRLTSVWEILNPQLVSLGYVKWYARWRRYAFEPAPSCVFDAACLSELVRFLDAKMHERREAHP